MELLERFTFMYHGNDTEVYTAQRTKGLDNLPAYLVMWKEGRETACTLYPVSTVENMVNKGYWLIQD
jgi:hypothetical protein